MNQDEKRLFLIRQLIYEEPEYCKIHIPDTVLEQKRLLRSLMNIRYPQSISQEFLSVQDDYLKAEIAVNGITRLEDLEPISGDLYLWQGDITTIRCGAIVNAANSGMTGCYYPCHSCIDNCIHTFAGIQLRSYCNDLMEKQGFEEPTGKAKITPAFNLPCKYVIHTVGPIVYGKLNEKECRLLESCYQSCLKLADENEIDSIAFCCISTGEFHFPNEKAAEIAVRTVCNYKQKSQSNIKVIFNVFKEKDLYIYRRLLE